MTSTFQVGRAYNMFNFQRVIKKNNEKLIQSHIIVRKVYKSLEV